MNEIDFVWNNYPKIQTFSKKQVERFFTVYKDRIIVVYDLGKIKGIGIYFKLTDETLEKVRTGKMNLRDPKNTNECCKENGKNIHFILVIADGFSTIMNGLRRVMGNNTYSISWFSPDMEQFFIRRILCHQ